MDSLNKQMETNQRVSNDNPPNPPVLPLPVPSTGPIGLVRAWVDACQA